MPGSQRWRLFLALAAVCMIVGLAGTPRRIVQERVEGPAWRPFRVHGGSFTPPSPAWFVADPFSSRVPYYGNVWFVGSPADRVRRAYLHSPDGRHEVFLMCGSRAQLDALLERAAGWFDGHPTAGFEPAGVVETAMGTRVEYRVAHLPDGESGGAMSYLLAQARDGDRVLVVNAGAPAARFDLPALLQLIRSIRLPAS